MPGVMHGRFDARMSMAMRNAERIFVDTNVIIRATINPAPLHQQARDKLDQLWEQGAELYISQQVIREYLVNTTRPQTYSPALPIKGVLQQVQRLQESFIVLHEIPSVLETLLRLAGTVQMGGKQIHDANIAATMLAHGIPTLLTHNVSDFARFSTYITVVPLAQETA